MTQNKRFLSFYLVMWLMQISLHLKLDTYKEIIEGLIKGKFL